jgi:hypothetical protein
VLASAVARSLHKHSASLQGKHDALFSRMPSPTPPSQSQSQTHSADTPYGSLLLSSRPSTPIHQDSVRRIRKISVSPADIALLADQNSELMQKLERLETESGQADKAGRRKLNRLEKDILALREELERTREKSDALEEQAKKNEFGLISADKKREREERVRMLRGGCSNSDDDHSEEGLEQVRDFAPGSIMKISTSSSSAYGRRELGDDGIECSTSSSPEKPSPEYDLIAQVLVKIQELEETNRQIACQQAETTMSLTAVQRDAERIGQLYDLLTEHGEPNLEIVVEKDEAGSRDGNGNGNGSSSPEDPETIRFRSLRKTLEGDLSRTTAGTVRAYTGKARKSVVGYFDHAPVPKSPAPKQEVAVGTSSIPSLPSRTSHSRTSSESFLSPALSSLSMLTPHSDALRQLAQMVSEDGHSLGNELGYEDIHATNHVFSPSHHLDMYQLSGAGREGSVLSGDDDTSWVCPPQPSTDPTDASPENWDAENRGNAEMKSLKYKQMLQTVRLRTNQWVDVRFNDPGDDSNNKDDVTQQPATASLFSQCLDEHKDRSQTGLKTFMFQIWLWLQFVIILLVFVWVVLRKGPKSVLNPDRKRAPRGA